MTIDMDKLSPSERAFVKEHELLHREYDHFGDGDGPAAALQQAATPKQPTPLQKQVGGTHYKQFPIQPVEFITKNELGFLEGCIIKRLCRHGSKNGIEDLLKAKHEIDLLIALEYPNSQE